MTTVMLRDDDANATTDPARFARIFAPILDAGLPINLSVIPDVALDTRAPEGHRERFLDEATPDVDRTELLHFDTPIAQWIRAHSSQVGVLVHGLSHRRVRGGTEFGALDAGEARARMSRGAEVLARALGERPRGFVAPWDALSEGSVTAATELFDLVSTSWVDRSRLPVSAWPAHVIERMGKREVLRVRNSVVLRHRGGQITPTMNPSDVAAALDRLSLSASVAVVVLHHWMFERADGPHPVIVALADALHGRSVSHVNDVANAFGN